MVGYHVSLHQENPLINEEFKDVEDFEWENSHLLPELLQLAHQLGASYLMLQESRKGRWENAAEDVADANRLFKTCYVRFIKYIDTHFKRRITK